MTHRFPWCSSQRSLLKTYVQFEYYSADKDPRKQSYCYRVAFHQSNENYLQLFYRAIQSSSDQSWLVTKWNLKYHKGQEYNILWPRYSKWNEPANLWNFKHIIFVIMRKDKYIKLILWSHDISSTKTIYQILVKAKHRS